MTDVGDYLIMSAGPRWEFRGKVANSVSALRLTDASDALGSYEAIAFNWNDEGQRSGEIRVYSTQPVVVFISKCLQGCKNSVPFPSFSQSPSAPFHLAYEGLFGHYTFNDLPSDSPWIFFDSQANTWILSPASDFLTSATSRDAGGGIQTGIDPDIRQLPAGFLHSAILVIGKGINDTFETWGRALTSISGKKRPTNDADTILKYLGYWTDNGATYYYKFDSSLGYAGTLLAVRDDFARNKIPLGYMQLDSWFYPKGPMQRWDKFDGIYEYVASPVLFPEGLEGFHKKLGLPLITHSRWIDPASPYHQQYEMSRNTVTDPMYWQDRMKYLGDSGVVTYEQDWLDNKALPALNLHDPAAFMDNMAKACRENHLTIQYCMPLPRHYLQSSIYSNVTTIRTSGDRFDRKQWDAFLYGARLANALGTWPWADVFMSSETDNMLLATLSSGPVGVGDAVGKLNRNNLMKVVRADGIIVKPDATLAPADKTFLQDASGRAGPMIAATYSDFGAVRALYVVGYQRETSQPVAFLPSDFGLRGQLVAFDYLGREATVVSASNKLTIPQRDGFGYMILMPLGKSGMTLLGDADQFVPLGKKRIAKLSDSGNITVTVLFAKGEAERELIGYAPAEPDITAMRGSVGQSKFDPDTRLFHVKVSPDRKGGEARITLRQE